MSWRQEYWRSIKSFDTEEKLDLYFYRPFGFLIAKAAQPLKLSPTTLTVFGLLLGLASGYFFFHNESDSSLVIACSLFVLAGVFDSSDGQLARMGGRSTKLGLVLDGICDNVVFGTAYIASSATMIPLWGHWIWLLAVVGGICHSFQSSLLDYYNREYLYFGYAKTNGDYWNPTLAEATEEKAKATGWERHLWNLRFSWIWQQNQLSSRRDETRYAWRTTLAGPHAEEFQRLYREHNRFNLRLWRLMGANFHTILIILFVFARRFDLYLLLGDILFLTFALFTLREIQRRQDRKLALALANRGIL
jgi:hypothetical protein